jgi:AcrR family transcriptional regulator
MTKRNTRELILRTALGLFNELGEPHVTTNHIADDADISPGNLYYHFHSKQDIVLDLFKRFAVQFEPLLDVPSTSQLEAEDLWFQLHLSFELKGQYRFLYRNLADLVTRIPDLDRAFRGLFRRERQATAAMISSLEQRGALHVAAVEKDLLLDNLMLSLMYWIPYAELFGGRGMADESAQARAIAGVLQLLVPYLREPEHSEFATLTTTYLSHAR